MMQIKNFKSLLFLAFAMQFIAVAEGQETMFQSLQSTPDLGLTIVCNWDTLRLQPPGAECKSTTLINGKEWKTELELRGVSRKAKCDSSLIPFRLQFKKKALRKAGYKEMRNHKIVTYCKENDAGLENLQEELLIYQLYEILTDQSFRSVEAELTQKWPDDEFPERTIPILILEPNNEMEDRLGGVEFKGFGRSADSIYAESYNRVAMFQFMIGNFDWSQSVGRNVKMIEINSKAVIVPYDFDYSAIVSPSYASLPSNLGLKDFKDRLYLGEFFIDKIPETEAEFIRNKDALYDHVLQFEGLKKYRRKQIKRYLDIFFDFIEDADHTLAHGTILSYKQR